MENNISSINLFFLNENIVIPKNVLENVSDIKLMRVMNRIVATELSNITKPGYLPKIVKYWEDLKIITGISDENLLEFKKNIFPQYLAKMDIFSDKYVIFCLICMIYYYDIKKIELSKLFFQFLAIKTYSNIAHKQFPKNIFNDNIWNMSLDRLSPRHLFRLKNGISGALFYLANVEFIRAQTIINKPIDKIVDFDVFKMVYRLRHRISQSFKTFANQYYLLFQKNKILSEPEQGNVQKGIELVSSRLSEMICTYSIVDKIALNKAVTTSGIRKDIVDSVIKEFSSVSYIGNIKFLILSIYNINQKITCLESERIKLIRRIILSNNPKEESIKNIINNLLNKLSVKNKLQSIPDEQKYLMVLHYITMFIKNRSC